MKEKNGAQMRLSDTKIEQLNKQPIVESQVQYSDDKKWLIHTTKIVDIKPAAYYEKVLARQEA